VLHEAPPDLITAIAEAAGNRSFEASSRRAFSIPPVASTTTLASTVNRMPPRVAQSIAVTRRPSSAVTSRVAVALSSTRTLPAASITGPCALAKSSALL
jgi:hypothetical protein